MDLTLHQDTFTLGERDWLGSAHGTDRLRVVTLDVTAFTAGTHYPNGYINSGIVIAKRTADGLYVPYANGGVGGAGSPIGFIFTDSRVIPLGSTAASAKVHVPLFHHGDVVVAKLPSNSGLDAGAQTALAALGLKFW